MCYQLRQGEAICIAVTPVFPGKVQGDVLLLESKPTGFLIFSRGYRRTWESSLPIMWYQWGSSYCNRSFRCTVYSVCFWNSRDHVLENRHENCQAKHLYVSASFFWNEPGRRAVDYIKNSDCMFELLFCSLLDRVTFIYFYVFAITLRPCCIICTLLHCGDWFSFVSGYVADMPVLPMSVWIDWILLVPKHVRSCL